MDDANDARQWGRRWASAEGGTIDRGNAEKASAKNFHYNRNERCKHCRDTLASPASSASSLRVL